jgi:hypothetical protein
MRPICRVLIARAALTIPALVPSAGEDHTTGSDRVVGTLGRSAWILDDLTPVRELSAAIAAAEAPLFPPRPAARWRRN